MHSEEVLLAYGQAYYRTQEGDRKGIKKAQG